MSVIEQTLNSSNITDIFQLVNVCNVNNYTQTQANPPNQCYYTELYHSEKIKRGGLMERRKQFGAEEQHNYSAIGESNHHRSHSGVQHNQ